MIENREQQIKSASEIIAYGCSDELKAALIQDFPELAESEDERIRKLLVWQVHRNIEDETNDLAQSVYDGIKGHDPDIEESIEDWKKCLAYLEKQKEQEPAKWSEEDKEWIAYFERLLEFAYNKDPRDLGSCCVAGKMWLKSLRPQPHWKPSEEQIKVMQKAVMYFGDSWVSKDQKTLESLYAELKKLM